MPLRSLAVVLMSFSTTVISAQAVAVGSPNNPTQLVAQSSPQRISVAFENTSLVDALWTIARRSGASLAFGESMLPKKQINYRADNVTPDAAFAAMLQGTGLKVNRARNGKLVLVDSKAGNAAQAAGVVTGKVTDAKTGKSVTGATVSIGPDRGAITGEDGSYRLPGISAGIHTLSVRLVGYAKQTRSVTVGDDATVSVDFRLEPSASVLDQVVVTGTVVSTELKAVPSAMTVITAKQIEERGITRIEQLFRGDIPGLFALETGSAGAFTDGSLDEVLMFSRGVTRVTLTPTATSAANGVSNPIKTYVDGVELSNPQFLSQIDPKSIERIEVLTGPQASTIYGANAITGVMQIFTKRGTTSKPSVTLSLSEGLVQNDYSPALTPSHRHDGTISGTEGKLSYNLGGGWDYTGAWTPSKQLQRTSLYGATRYQAGPFSLDMSERQGWTKNKVRGDVVQTRSILTQTGAWEPADFTGILPPFTRSLSGRTLGATVGFTPYSWWSHQLNIGSDASDVQAIGSGASFEAPDDSSYSNNENFNTRTSESYSSTLRLPISSLAQATLTYGGDHWRSSTSRRTWQINRAGQLHTPSVTRDPINKNTGAYIQAQLGLWDELFITYGLRADWAPNYGEDATVRPGRYGVSYAKELGSVSAKLRASYGRSIRPPTLGLRAGDPVTAGEDEIPFYAQPGTTLYTSLPAPELGPEFQQGGEGGLELYFGNRASLVVTRYNQTVDGLINTVNGVDSVRALQPGRPTSTGITNCSPTSTTPANAPRSDGYCYYIQRKELNIGSIRNQGWETQGSINFGHVTTRGTYSWTKSRILGVTPAYVPLLNSLQVTAFAPGQTSSFAAEHTWALATTYANQRSSVAFNLNGIGNSLRGANSVIGRVASSSIRLRSQEAYSFAGGVFNNLRLAQGGYMTADLNASHRLSPKVQGMLQITNLTDHYRNDISYSYASIGRQTRLGVRLRWQ